MPADLLHIIHITSSIISLCLLIYIIISRADSHGESYRLPITGIIITIITINAMISSNYRIFMYLIIPIVVLLGFYIKNFINNKIYNKNFDEMMKKIELEAKELKENKENIINY